jgi:4-hydroxybenzoyl-CoA reductase subunit beta
MTVLPDFRTVRPASLADAVAALGVEGARPLAGATDLLPNLRRGLGEPAALVDLTAVPELAAIADQGGSLRIGAAVTLEALAEHPLVQARFPVLAEAALAVAGPTHRAAATLGGNLCQDTRCVFYNQSEWWRWGNDYCLKLKGDRCHVVVKSDRCYATYHGDVAPALMVLDAQAEITGPNGSRNVALAKLFVESGAAHLALDKGEIVTAVVVPPAEGWVAGYAKVRVRDAIDFPLAGVAVAIKRDGDRIGGIRVAVTGTNSAPLAVPLDALVGTEWSAAGAEVLQAAIRRVLNVLKTTVTGPKYRRKVLLATAQRLAEQVWARR